MSMSDETPIKKFYICCQIDPKPVPGNINENLGDIFPWVKYAARSLGEIKEFLNKAWANPNAVKIHPPGEKCQCETQLGEIEPEYVELCGGRTQEWKFVDRPFHYQVTELNLYYPKDGIYQPSWYENLYDKHEYIEEIARREKVLIEMDNEEKHE